MSDSGWILVKPVRGGLAFWRSMLLLIDGSKLPAEIVAVRLHSRAWLYILPANLLDEELLASNMHNIAAMIRVDCKPVIQGETRVLSLRVTKVERLWYTSRELEVCDEGQGKCFRVGPVYGPGTDQILPAGSEPPSSSRLRDNQQITASDTRTA